MYWRAGGWWLLGGDQEPGDAAGCGGRDSSGASGCGATDRFRADIAATSDEGGVVPAGTRSPERQDCRGRVRERESSAGSDTRESDQESETVIRPERECRS